jgi:hypothetical protein
MEKKRYSDRLLAVGGGTGTWVQMQLSINAIFRA